MTSFAGIDFDSRAVHVVLVDEDTLQASYHRYELEGADAFDRCRSIRRIRWDSLWDDVVACAVEEPMGHNTRPLNRVQGSILARLPDRLLVHPLRPNEWRKLVGLPGNASKADVVDFCCRDEGIVAFHSPQKLFTESAPQDMFDATCLALAVRQLVTKEKAA